MASNSGAGEILSKPGHTRLFDENGEAYIVPNFILPAAKFTAAAEDKKAEDIDIFRSRDGVRLSFWHKSIAWRGCSAFIAPNARFSIAVGFRLCIAATLRLPLQHVAAINPFPAAVVLAFNASQGRLFIAIGLRLSIAATLRLLL